MKRSQINALIDDAIALLREHQVRLPRFAYWTPAEWNTKGAECDEIRQCKLGWDITECGSGGFPGVGLVVFTVRNGHHQIEPYARKKYAEKILIVRENQHTPMHCHALKAEDIICRSGGTLLIKVNNRAPDGALAKTEVEVSLDGERNRVKAGHIFRLSPQVVREFWAEPSKGISIVGEVSSVNDDDPDNYFVGKVGRFPAITED